MSAPEPSVRSWMLPPMLAVSSALKYMMKRSYCFVVLRPVYSSTTLSRSKRMLFCGSVPHSVEDVPWMTEGAFNVP